MHVSHPAMDPKYQKYTSGRQRRREFWPRGGGAGQHGGGLWEGGLVRCNDFQYFFLFLFFFPTQFPPPHSCRAMALDIDSYFFKINSNKVLDCAHTFDLVTDPVGHSETKRAIRTRISGKEGFGSADVRRWIEPHK